MYKQKKLVEYGLSMITIRIPHKLRDRINQAARAADMSQNGYIVRAIKTFQKDLAEPPKVRSVTRKPL